MISGLSPCVLRASLMFTVILIAEMMFRKTNIFQSLILSAFILLLLNPYFLFDTGFQLSYLAVIGIVIFQKPIVSLCQPKNKIVKMAWELIAVSLAAQLATIPLTFLYFHQFPTYFLIANLIAIPYTNILMFAALGVIFLSPIVYLSSYLGIALAKALFWFNKIIFFLNQLPFASIRNIHFDGFDALLLGGILISWAFWISSKRYKLILLGFFLFFVFSSKQLIEKLQVLENKNITVYGVKNHSVIGFTQGTKCFILTDSSLTQQSGLWLQHISNNMSKNRISDVGFIYNLQKGSKHVENNFCQIENYIHFCKQTICVLDSNNSLKRHEKLFPVDMLIVTQKTKRNIELILKEYQPKRVVVDANVSLYFTKRWLKACEKAKVICYNVKEKGAFQLNL